MHRLSCHLRRVISGLTLSSSSHAQSSVMRVFFDGSDHESTRYPLDSFAHTFTLPHSHTLTHTHTHTHSHAHALTLSHTHSHSLTLTLPLSHTLALNPPSLLPKGVCSKGGGPNGGSQGGWEARRVGSVKKGEGRRVGATNF